MSLEELIRESNPAAGAEVPRAASATAERIAARVFVAVPGPGRAGAGGRRSHLLPAVAAVAFCAVVVGAVLAVSYATKQQPVTPVGTAPASHPSTSVTVPVRSHPRHPGGATDRGRGKGTSESGQGNGKTTVTPPTSGPPKGWVAVTLGAATLYVPPSWDVVRDECAAWRSPGTVFVRQAKVLTVFCPYSPVEKTALSASDNALVVTPIGVLDAPGGVVGTRQVAGFTASEYVWPRSSSPTESQLEWPAGRLQLRIASLGVNLVISGPLSNEVLSTLRRT